MLNKKTVPFGSANNYIKEIQKKQRHSYMMLSRFQQDLDYYFNYGNRDADHALYFENYKKHIMEMQKVYNLLKIKPEWISQKEITEYENRIDYKWYVFKDFDNCKKTHTYRCTDGDYTSDPFKTYEEAQEYMKHNYLLKHPYEKISKI